jgi:hypothetical protein
MALTNNSINRAHDSNWRVMLSNFPNYESATQDIDMQIFNLYCKGITFPDLAVDYNRDPMNGFARRFAKSHYNTDWPEFQLTYLVGENMENYLRTYYWGVGLRQGVPMYGVQTVVDSVIKYVTVEMLDNQKRPICQIDFKDCTLVRLSNLQLTAGQAGEMQFTMTLWPAQTHYNVLDPNGPNFINKDELDPNQPR